MTTHDRDRILAGERLAQSIRLLREVLAMDSEVRGGYKPLLDIIHGVERLADGLRDDHDPEDTAAVLPAPLPNYTEFKPRWMRDREPGDSILDECPATGSDPEPPPTANEPSSDLSRWSDRLTWDHNISADSPVIRGTWVTVSHVVSLIIDGWTWSDVLRTHPELAVEDVRVCLAYTVADANGDT